MINKTYLYQCFLKLIQPKICTDVFSPLLCFQLLMKLFNELHMTLTYTYNDQWNGKWNM